ncbi:MAG TPA: GNAT family N-acetyltransferase [Anaerolineaceae bacterium]|nr:GNAT family N-acetyltransferase [Anaerolineaceae bacterium]
MMEPALIPQVIHTRDLDAATREEIVRLCTEAFHSDASFLFHHLPEDSLHVLGFLGGELVSHAVRTTRWAQIGRGPLLKTAYIDAVATLERYQGQGFGSKVMGWIAEEISSEDYQICALETDRPGFYTRLGWEVWPGPLGGRRDRAVIPTPEAQGHVLILRTPYSPRIDLNNWMTIEEQGRFW